MAGKLPFNDYEVRELKLGASFTDSDPSSQYHTVKYDFRPASVDQHKVATVDVAANNEVTITVPHLDGAGVPETIFKGSQRPYTKECVLIIDRATGEVTLEKLSSNIQVKKTRDKKSNVPIDRATGEIPPENLPSNTQVKRTRGKKSNVPIDRATGEIPPENLPSNTQLKKTRGKKNNVPPRPISPVPPPATNTTQSSTSRTPAPRGKRNKKKSSVTNAKPKPQTVTASSGTAPETPPDVAGPSNPEQSLPRLTIWQPPPVTWHHPSPWTGGDDSDATLPVLGEVVSLAPAFLQEQFNPLYFTHQQASSSTVTASESPLLSPVHTLQRQLDNNSPLSVIEISSNSDTLSVENDNGTVPSDWLFSLLNLHDERSSEAANNSG